MNASRLVLIVFISVSLRSWADSTSLNFETHLYTTFVDSPVLKSRLMGTIAELGFERHLGESLDARIQGGMRLEGGSSRALYNDEFAPRQTPLLREASVNLNLFTLCRVSVGALNENFLESPLIVMDQSFPGFHEHCFVGGESWQVSADLEQAYASDTQFTHPTGRQLQSDAQFFIERLSGSYRLSDNLGLNAHVSHYMYGGLSALVAYRSQFMGNSSSGLDENNADFRYGFQSYEFGLGAKWKIKNTETELRASSIRNSLAPNGSNGAYEILLKSKIAGEKYAYKPMLRYFRIESDATPAYFNDPATAHANVQGIEVELTFEMLQSKAEAAVTYVASKPISETLYQPGVQTWLYAVLRINYDIL